MTSSDALSFAAAERDSTKQIDPSPPYTDSSPAVQIAIRGLERLGHTVPDAGQSAGRRRLRLKRG